MENTKNNTIGRLLQYAREAKGLRQADMVEATGLSKNHISAVERGESKASVNMLLGYCNKLNVSPDFILNYKNNEGEEVDVELELKSSIDIMLNEEVSKMDERTKNRLLEIAKILNK